MFKEMITTQIIFLSSSLMVFVKFTIYYIAKKPDTLLLYTLFWFCFFNLFKIRIAVFERDCMSKMLVRSQVYPSLQLGEKNFEVMVQNI